MEKLVKLGATAARSPADVADRVETVMTSLPSLDIGLKVVSGDDGLTRGNRVRRYVDLSTTGSRAAIKTAEIMKERNIVQIDSPVSRRRRRRREGHARGDGVRAARRDRAGAARRSKCSARCSSAATGRAWRRA